VSVLGDEVENLARARANAASEVEEWRRRALDAERALRAVDALRTLWDGDFVPLVADDVAGALHRAMTNTNRDGTPLARTTEPEESPES
jgi:hypothetical protein